MITRLWDFNCNGPHPGFGQPDTKVLWLWTGLRCQLGPTLGSSLTQFKCHLGLQTLKPRNRKPEHRCSAFYRRMHVLLVLAPKSLTSRTTFGTFEGNPLHIAKHSNVSELVLPGKVFIAFPTHGVAGSQPHYRNKPLSLEPYCALVP